MRTLLNILCVCLLAGFAGAAMAQTPDGEPPSVETVCTDANYIGAAWGLCNAYCEAMDCDCPTEAHPNCVPKASPKACAKVLSNFYKHVGDGVTLVCEEAPPENFHLEVQVINADATSPCDPDNPVAPACDGGDVTSPDIGSNMTGIDCPDSACFEVYADGTSVTLTATPDDGWSFDGWGGDCASANPSLMATVTMDQMRSCTATFSEDVMVPECGNGIVEGDEECDDGNLIPGDGCDASCMWDCPCVDFGSGWTPQNFLIIGNWSFFANGGGASCVDNLTRIEITDPAVDGGSLGVGAVNYGSSPFQCELNFSVNGSATWGLTSSQAEGCAGVLRTAFEDNNGDGACDP